MDGPSAHQDFIKSFLAAQYPNGDIPLWVVDALTIGAGIEGVTSTLKQQQQQDIAVKKDDEQLTEKDNNYQKRLRNDEDVWVQLLLIMIRR